MGHVKAPDIPRPKGPWSIERYVSAFARHDSNAIESYEYDEIGARVVKGYTPWLSQEAACQVAYLVREALIDKACKWIDENIDFYKYEKCNLTKHFREAMKER